MIQDCIQFYRGAELIEELMQNQIRDQEEVEKEVLEKIKMKMDRIKATHKKQHKDGDKEVDNHFDGKFLFLPFLNELHLKNKLMLSVLKMLLFVMGISVSYKNM